MQQSQELSNEKKLNEVITGKPKVEFFNLLLLAWYLPLSAKASISHRISGLVLVLFFTPFLLFSLSHLPFFLFHWLSSKAFRFLVLVLLLFFNLYLFLGLRLILLELHIFVSRQGSRTSAYLAFGLAILATILIGFLTW